MTVEEALIVSDEWTHGATFYEGQGGWRPAVATLATEIRRLQADLAEATASLNRYRVGDLDAEIDRLREELILCRQDRHDAETAAKQEWELLREEWNNSLLREQALKDGAKLAGICEVCVETANKRADRYREALRDISGLETFGHLLTDHELQKTKMAKIAREALQGGEE